MASPVCKLPVCSRPARARGLCNTHYQRKRLELKDWDKDVRRRRLDLKPIGLIKLSKKAADYYKWVADQRAMHPDDCAREVLEAYAANRMAEIIIDARTKSNPWDREGSTLDQDIEVPK